MRALALPDVLRDAGLKVQVQPGWQRRGRDMHDIKGLVWHHTATGPHVSDANVVDILRDGRAGLSGPLSQLGLSRDGTWHVVASGRANHAGVGEWPGLDGNDDCLGIEAFHTGTNAERWTSRQLASWRVGSAAICDAWGINPRRFMLGHKEWAPRRKIDPYGVYMPNERRNVAALIEEKHNMSNPSDWAAAAWDKAVKAGVMSDHSEPHDTLTKQELAVFLDRAGVLDPDSPAGEHTHRASIRLT